MADFKQVRKFLIPYFLVLVLVASAFSAIVAFNLNDRSVLSPDTNVGVAFCGNTTEEAKLLIDRVKTYTNLFILNAAGNPINRNQTTIEEICDYAVSKGLKVIINLGFNSTGRNFARNWFWNLSSLDGIKQRWTGRWGSKFLGIYYSDEPGGIQLDGDWENYFSWLGALSQNPLPENFSATIPSTYVDAIHNLAGIYEKIQEANGSAPADYDTEADFFVNDVIRNDPGFSSLKKTGFSTFTSDYGLYWFDYLGGYDVLLAQLGWNCSVAQQVDLVRGAARIQERDWGVIITWKSDSYPYLDTADHIYNQMMTSYQAGADYIVLFNYPIIEGNDYGLMNDDHFFALERFWNNAIKMNKGTALNETGGVEAAMVLPRNYGWGMRRPDDVIWGFWESDEKSIPIGTLMGKLLAKYGISLDIIYEDAAYPVAEGDYPKIYYWNSTL